MVDKVDFELEYHFMSDEELPEDQRVDQGVRIVQTKSSGEFLIEDGFDKEEGLIIIGIGGLKLKVKQQDFNIAYMDYMTRKVTNLETKDINSSKVSK